MSKTVSPNYTDTTPSGWSGDHGITIPKTNTGVDFRVESQKANSLIITNLTSPIGYPETVKFSTETIPDMYAGTTVEKALYAPSRKGRGVLVSLHDVFKETSSTDETYEKALPFKTSIAFQFLQNSSVTTAMVLGEIARLLSFLYDTTSATMNSRLEALIRGSLKPNDM